jgi:hypothetical protein
VRESHVTDRWWQFTPSQTDGLPAPARRLPEASSFAAASLGGLPEYPYGIFPLRVLKQIVVMFFSACGPSLRKAHPELVGFVLNRSQRYFPQNVQIWAYLHDPVESISTRQSGVTGMMRPGGEFVFSEIAFPPFGLIMSFRAEPVKEELCNLTHFHLSTIDRWDIEYLKMPVLPVVSFFPGDFRTVTEIRKSMTESQKLGSYFFNTPLQP